MTDENRREVPLPASLLSPYYERGYYERQQVPEERYLDIVELMRDNPHWLIFGMTGTGKGLLGSSIIEDWYEAGGKVVSIRCTKDMEHLFKKYPTDGAFKRHVENQRKEGYSPRGYPVKAYVPVCDGNLPKELPDFFDLYTIPLKGKTVTAELLSTISMVGLTDIGVDAVNEMLRGLPKRANVVDLYIGLEKLLEKGFVKHGLKFETIRKETRPSIHRIIYSLVKYLIMTDEKHKLAMTDERFEKILNNQKEISVFVQAFTPLQLQPFFSLLPLELVFQNAEKCEHPILLVATEIQQIMWNQAENRRNSNPAMDLFNKRVADLVRSGRKFNIRFVGDTQNLSDISPTFVGQAHKLSFHYEIESEKVYRQLGKKRRWMSLEDLNNTLLFLRHESKKALFEFFSFDKGKVFQVRIPRTAHPYEGNRSDFLQYVRSVDPKREWFKTAPICKELEAAIINTAMEKHDVLKPKSDVAALEIKKKMGDEEAMRGDNFGLNIKRQ